jgi:hypothetical protein
LKPKSMFDACAVAIAGTTEASKGVVVGAVGVARAVVRVMATGAVSVAAVLVADAYATVGVVSCRVGAVDVGAGGNATAVNGVGAAAEAGMGAAVTGVSMTATVGVIGAGATAVEGDADGGAAGTEGGGTTCGDDADDDGGYGVDCQGRGSRLSLAIFSSSRALRVGHCVR